jgi:hypothetical protein
MCNGNLKCWMITLYKPNFANLIHVLFIQFFILFSMDIPTHAYKVGVVLFVYIIYQFLIQCKFLLEFRVQVKNEQLTKGDDGRNVRQFVLEPLASVCWLFIGKGYTDNPLYLYR